MQDTIGDLETKIEMSKEMATNKELIKQENLVAASTSDKLAASRAMKQNKQLKNQVEEFEHAIMQLSNTKAELMTKLDESATMMKSLAESESSLKSQVNTMQEGIKERDRNIQRMKDQMKHYVAFAETSALGRQNDDEIAYLQDNYNKLMTDLVDAKEEIRCLNSHNSELKGQLEVLSSQTRES